MGTAVPLLIHVDLLNQNEDVVRTGKAGLAALAVGSWVKIKYLEPIVVEVRNYHHHVHKNIQPIIDINILWTY
jgi:hypothetical protein